MKDLSVAARALWAKKGKPGEMTWLPLYRHLADAAGVMRLLWNNWLPSGARNQIAAGLSDPEKGQQLAVFLAAAHDLGKALPAFQGKTKAFVPDDLDELLLEGLLAKGLPCDFSVGRVNAKETPHGLASQVLLQHAGCDLNIASIVGAHHGRPATSQQLDYDLASAYPGNFHMGAQGKAAWGSVQAEILAYALRLSGTDSLSALPLPDFRAQMLLCGLLIVADWIASNERLFPHWVHGQTEPAATDQGRRVDQAWEGLRFPMPWQQDDLLEANYFVDRFDIKSPYPSQKAALQIAQAVDQPGIFILEAPMGAGKTESALVAAEVFAQKARRSGVFFALPTQATSNAIFTRMLRWTQELDVVGKHAIRLAHGKAQFQEEYSALLEGSRGIGEGDEDVMVHQWFEGSKKALLADFVVGTIDQFLMSTLRQKHVMLRHLGLLGKVVILDECHAYDSYMNKYLDQALQWMGAYQVPVIVLSATLPAGRRSQLVQAYLGKGEKAVPRQRRYRQSVPPPVPEPWMVSRGYPLITWTDGAQVFQRELAKEGPARRVQLERLPDEELVGRLQALLQKGGYAGVVVNTVARAQRFYEMLQQAFGKEEVTLVHSRFIAPDRAQKESGLLSMLGKPGDALPRSGTHIVVGTQVIEQSLDLDFDVLASDLCPMDLLLQRMGRLHRHVRSRPPGLHQARCLILGEGDQGFEPGALAIYKALPLMRTRALLPRDHLVLPDDIPRLTQQVYDLAQPLAHQPDAYLQAQAEWEGLIDRQQGKAAAYLLRSPQKEESLIDLLAKTPAEAAGEAAVRDAADCLEVLVIREVEPGFYAPLPWVEYEQIDSRIPATGVPDRITARVLARQSLRLPPSLCHPGIIDQTIAALEASNQVIAPWQGSPWLAGQLFVILNPRLEARICGYLLSYQQELGLVCQKEGEDHATKGIQPD